MRSSIVNLVVAVSALTAPQLAQAADEVHGQGVQGTVMGPVAFMWPSDRVWSGSEDNVAPCGNAAIMNRTDYPVGVTSKVALTIASEAWNVALRIAYGNNPTTQAEFQSLNANVTEVDPGHQCYGVSTIPSTVSSGSNATLQLEYWSNDSGKNESFYVCSDITFVQASAFTLNPPCFNVTVNDFTLASTSATSTAAAATATAATTSGQTAAASPSAETSGLSAGAKAGISVGAVVGAFLVLGGLAMAIRRKRQSSKKDAEAAMPQMKDTASLRSGVTVVQQ